MVKNIFRILQFLGIVIIIYSIFISNNDFMNKYSILSLGFSMEELGTNYKGNEKAKNDIERCKKIKKRYKKIKLDEKYREFFMCNEYGEVYEVILVPQVIFYVWYDCRCTKKVFIN